MNKRFLDNKSMEQEYEERRQFIRQNAPSMELKTLAKRFFMKFDLQKAKATSKLSLLTATKRCRTQLEVSGVIKGSHMIQSGMNLLVPEANSPYSTDDGSQGGECSGAVSPSVAHQERREVRAGSSIDKEKRGTEPSGASVFMSTSIPSEKAQKEFPARDGIADLTHDSSFCQTLDPTVLSIVRRAEPAPNIYERWPTLGPICDRVFVSNNYDEVASAVRSESMRDPIAAYLFVTIMAYWQYFHFHDEIPENINEREGFTGLTWSFMQTPLTLYGIQSRYLEVLITAVEGRKNQDKDPLLEVKEIGQYADAVAIYNNQQLLLAEAALIHYPTFEKRRQDEFKLARAMRDSWISHVRSVSSLAVPPRDLAVFGSVSFKDETKLLRMDFQGAFRLQQFDLFVIPLNKSDFGNKMRAAVISCLELAARLYQEIERRRQPSITLGYYDRVALADASRLIEKTTSTPTRIPKTPKKK
ncbi:hypothetical protein BGX33_001621 [Mortierella sp. NVP41]|nr:hypothetical protein BGX33_001621 [Mortierella sp. NVP41]